MPDHGEEGRLEAGWTSRSIGSRLQHSIFYTLIRLGGRRAAYAVLSLVALYYALFRPAIRKKADPYLDRRFGAGRGFKRFIDCYRMYENLGEALIDRAIIGIKGPGSVRIVCDGRNTLKGLIGEGHGLVLLTAHVGCWQAAMSSLLSLNTPVSLVLHHEEGDIDRHYYEHSGDAPPFRVIDPLGYLGGVLEMVEVLKKGEVLSIMGDRVFGEARNTVEAQFLGGPVRLPLSAYKLASATGAPIAVLLSHKCGPDTYELTIDDIIRVPREKGRPEEVFGPYAGRFARALESYVEHHPYQFFNFYDMWEEA